MSKSDQNSFNGVIPTLKLFSCAFAGICVMPSFIAISQLRRCKCLNNIVEQDHRFTFYGFGGGRPVSILLNDHGAEIVDQLRLSESIREGQPRTRICNVELLSTVGTECFLSYKGINFILPKSVIISWTAIDPRNNNGNRSPCDGDG